MKNAVMRFYNMSFFLIKLLEYQLWVQDVVSCGASILQAVSDRGRHISAEYRMWSAAEHASFILLL